MNEQHHEGDALLPQVHRLRGEVLEMEEALERAHCGRLELVHEKLRLAAALSAATSMLAGAHDTHVKQHLKKDLGNLISPHALCLSCLEVYTGLYV